ncbi:MAG: 30S ribosomal protein S3ae [Thermoplasmata archaeon]
MADSDTPAKKTTLARTVKDKWRSKHWYKVRAPGLFQHAELGETVATEPEQVIGRILEATLPELGGGADTGRAHIKLRFRIDRISGENIAETSFIGHNFTSDYIRRLARRKRSKIDATIQVITKDGVRFILKPVAVGEQRLQSHLRTELRHKLDSLLLEEAALRTSPEFVREMLQGELAKVLSQGLRTLYPLKKIEIRSSDVLGPIPEELPSSESPETETPSAPEAGAAPVA